MTPVPATATWATAAHVAARMTTREVTNWRDLDIGQWNEAVAVRLQRVHDTLEARARQAHFQGAA